MVTPVFYLYKIVNSVNDKVYIGVTKHPEQRFKQHTHEKSNCTHLKHAIKKYGSDKFQMVVLCCGDESYILDLEVKAINAFDSIKNGYNLVLGNPRSGGASHSPDTKKRISESLNKYWSENESPRKGVPTGPIKEYDPHFVSGFWFPHPNVAIEKLSINEKTFYRWRKEGTLGEVQHLRKDSIRDVPCYVAGFWFPTLRIASGSLEQEMDTLAKRIREGFVEQKSNKAYKTGEDNHMTGRLGSLHHNSKTVVVDFVTYGSVAEASRATEYTKKMIYTRIKNKVEGFAYAS